jgi:hypothetical protein
MNSPAQEPKVDLCHTHLTLKMRIGLCQLLKAHQAAKLVRRDKWDFAVEIQILREFGLDHSDLRSLLCLGLMEHGLEKTHLKANRRTFLRTAGLSLRADSCFVLSENGFTLAKRLSNAEEALQFGQRHLRMQDPHFRLVPVWDGIRRELCWGSSIVKRFRQPARNQETILAAFHEEGWPARIDDPLSGRKDRDAQERLHGAIKKLNRQKLRLLRFRSDGAGQGILWEPLTSDPGADQERPLTP